MSPIRPPAGGLFRLSGPAPRQPSEPDVRAEARQAIRHFVRVLERLDAAERPAARPRPATRGERAR